MNWSATSWTAASFGFSFTSQDGSLRYCCAVCGADPSVRQQALPIDSIDARRATSKSDEVQAKVTFVVVRVNEVEDSEDEDA